MPKTVSDLLPMVAAVVLIVLFAGLGFWQLDRADQKKAIQASFANQDQYRAIGERASPGLYEPITATGRFLNRRQFLIDNMIVDGRVGYYVITPFEYAAGQPLLLVNRGWVAKAPAANDLPSIAVSDALRTVRGKTGRLPRVAIRPGSALPNSGDWPKRATFPTTDELAEALDREVLPFVLLADPDPGADLVRQWQPQGFGPMRHYAYAFQWLALALTVIVVTLLLKCKKKAAR